MKHLLDLSQYVKHYKLGFDSVTIETIEPDFNLNQPGLLMHGSMKDPYLILKHGLVCRETNYFKGFKSEPQICLGLNNTNPDHTIKYNGAVKNTAVKYADYFKGDGMAYTISEDVKNFITYTKEMEDLGEYQRGIATLTESIPPESIQGIITKNLSKAIAAILKTRHKIPVYTPDGKQHTIVK